MSVAVVILLIGAVLAAPFAVWLAFVAGRHLPEIAFLTGGGSHD